VGTTVLTVCLALIAALADPRRKVCVVDFDLQTGDVRSYLNLTHRRSVADLVEVAHDLSAQQLHDAMSVHSSGLRVLLPPPEGEQGEAITSEVARRILGGVRARFDLVLVDCGSVMSEGSSVAVEMADQAVIVVTPDVPAMRAANRLLTLWERLQIRKDGIGVLVNRVSRDSEIQPDLVGKIVAASLCKTTIPSDFRSLEAAVNTGVPGRLEPGPISNAVVRLARELRLVRDPQRRLPAAVRALRSSSGQVAVETMGMTLVIGLVAMLLWEIVLVGFTFVLSGHAAREAARELAVGGPALEQVVREDLPSGWTDGASIEQGADWVEVTLRVPALVPGVHSPFTVATSAGTHRESG
jgi:pilus assembly protein CpaE